MHGSAYPTDPKHPTGDLRNDTVTIIGATLDLQDKTVRNAMTPIGEVFMLSVEARLDYETLRKICATGHSRIPVFEEVEVSHNVGAGATSGALGEGTRVSLEKGEKVVKAKVKKIIGILLVKQCVLLDPEGTFMVSTISLHHKKRK